MHSLSRRGVLRSLASVGFSALAAHASNLTKVALPAESNAIRLAAQTNAFPIDPRNFDSFLAALGDLKSVGYAGFETGFINLRSQAKSTAEARTRIEAKGLVFTGVHIFLPEYDPQTSIAPQALYESVARLGAELGAQRLILSGSPAVTPDEIKRKADALNRAGQFAKSQGLILAYHNHWPEYKYDGREILQVYADTDPASVSFLLDAGHAYRTGFDIPRFVYEHAARLTGIHFRDFREGKQVPLGQGTFPLRQVASSLERAKWSGWVINEEEREDGTKSGLVVLQPAYTALKGAFGA
ncbi:Sugar phosphate isomerase/epimerase [Granulicella pectinivorans]|uniref:Sugar phosphate isomerase/epimerase n=1 Tax=Granulicella pectinivorans TaxID=474950 RepID=A0A1I6MDP7_9BACT|nr:TIM barrel protein [Granulicella pectinivorans]SFS13717.1 Sugar phosphate isomerase/epimerase [Granulicella pectinivorans]